MTNPPSFYSDHSRYYPAHTQFNSMGEVIVKRGHLFSTGFCKAYDRVDWAFMFQVMEKLWMPIAFINMIRMLFYDVNVSTNINNQVTKPFEFHRGIHHCCPLAPYLFIITVETLNATVKYATSFGNLKGITLPQCNSHQNFSIMQMIRL